MFCKSSTLAETRNVMNEIWKDVKGYEGLYQVSNLGRVFGVKRKRIKKLTVDKKGYQNVLLSKDGKEKRYRVHKLVAMAFIPNPENKTEVHHIDFGKTNIVTNLMWVTPEEHKELHKENVLHVFQYSLNGEFIKEYSSIKEMAEQTGFDSITVIYCCNGKYKTAFGFQWRYEKYDHIPSVKTRNQMISESKHKPVEMCDMDWNHVAYFNSLKEASEKTGAKHNSISNNCRGKSKSVFVNGIKHRFRYKQPEAV